MDRLAALVKWLTDRGTSIAGMAASLTALVLTLSKSIGSLFAALKPIGVRMLKATTTFSARWQEAVVWMPLCVILGLLGWIVFGGLDRTAARDIIPLGAVLPWKVLYALAALQATHLVRRRWRMRLSPEQQKELWFSLLASSPGAIVIFITDAVVTLCALYWLLRFFSLAS